MPENSAMSLFFESAKMIDAQALARDDLKPFAGQADAVEEDRQAADQRCQVEEVQVQGTSILGYCFLGGGQTVLQSGY